MKEAKVSTLANGLRVVSDAMDTVETVSLGVWVGVGTRNEAAEVNGVSHFLEHMAFKGTERRSARAIAEEIEAVGGYLNAYTSREHTTYYAKVLKEDAPLALDILADILQHSVFDEEEMERERAVIIQEIGQAMDTPDDIIFDRFQATAFPDHPIGRPILGSAEVVRAMKRSTLVGYMRDHYHASRMVLAASGRIEHDALVELAEHAFDQLPSGEPPDGDGVRYEGGEFREARELEQVHLVLGFDGIAFGDADYYALSVLTTLFGGGMSSRLFQEVREKRGLAYNISSFATSYTDGGVFGIYAGTGERDLAELVPVLCDEMMKLGMGVGADEVERARAQLKASILMTLESTSARCELLGHQMLVFGRPIPASEVAEEIEAVDAATVSRVARRLLSSRPAVAAIGPIGRLETYDVISGRLA